MLFFVNLMSSVDINIFKRFDLKMFAEKEKRQAGAELCQAQDSFG